MAAGIKASADGLYGTLQVNSADVVTFNDSGNVGIGTLAPAAKLAVYTASGDLSAQVETAGAGQAGLNLYNSTRKFRIIADASASALVFYDQTASAERMRIDSSGNMGIGTSSVFDTNTRLELSKSGNCQQFISSTDGARLFFSASGSTSGIFGTFSNHPLVFKTNDTERARIDTSGNVGIGKTPTTKLDVNGTVTATAFSGTLDTTQVLTATASATFGAVGTYGFLSPASTATVYNPGDTIAGSSLRWAGAESGGTSATSSASGTWRCMGHKDATSIVSTVWLRIS